MFFNYKYLKYKGNEELSFAKKVETDKGFLKEEARRIILKAEGNFCKRLSLKIGIPKEFKNTSDEAYVLDLDKESTIYGASYRGLYYGLMTLEHLIDCKSLRPLVLYDYPSAKFRGYRTFIPGREEINFFKETIDMISYYKYNTLILEVGGAMEYKRHPKINDEWVDYCNKIRHIPGEADRIQNHTYPWQKNSIHVDNGAGGFLSQKELKDIIDYARERGLDVIPEVPTLSHCDYLLNAYPEFREREEDLYPDSYCPSKTGIYKLVFDILDEVIEVFEPKWIHIGHDEAYSLSVCQECSRKAKEDIFADDIKTIHGYLKDMDIKTMMWAEKLLVKEGDRYPYAKNLPNDILMINWYWNFNLEDDLVYYKHGYQMVFGNVRMSLLEEWKKRHEWGAIGAFVSNWGANSLIPMQRNVISIELVYSAYALWSLDNTKEGLLDKAFKELYDYRLRSLRGPLITLVHTCDFFIPYRYFFDGSFIEEETYKLGDYMLSYTDGTKAYIPVIYGTNISNRQLIWSNENIALLEVSGSTLPIKRGSTVHDGLMQLTWGGGWEKVQVDYDLFYEYSFLNPCPNKDLKSISFEKVTGKDFNIEYFLKRP